MTLTKALRLDIQALGERLSKAANAEEKVRGGTSAAAEKAQHAYELKEIAQAIKKLLNRIEDAVPLINLAITASGASLSSTLPASISPSRLLQASTFLTAGDSQYVAAPSGKVQIGPTFTLSLYMLFQGHARPQTEDDVRHTTWKEVIHKAVVRLVRVPMDCLYSPSVLQEVDETSKSEMVRPVADEYAYQLLIVEDLEDDRVHTFEDGGPQPGPFGDIELAGIREAIPIHELSKIFYADTGKILNIGNEGELNSPVLLLKRDLHAVPPRRVTDRYDDDVQPWNDPEGRITPDPNMDGDRHLRDTALQDEGESSIENSAGNNGNTWPPHAWNLPPDLDPEWMAFEVYTETQDSEDESDLETPTAKASRQPRSSSLDPSLNRQIGRLHVQSPGEKPYSPLERQSNSSAIKETSQLPPIRTSLSLLEMLLRLLSLQQFQQAPHLSIPDELLTFFLSESASTGAASNDSQERKRLREEARRHVGFDPYDESPVKRRGEDYQYRGAEDTESWDGESGRFTGERYGSPLSNIVSGHEDEGYGTNSWASMNKRYARSMLRNGSSESPLASMNSSSKGKIPKTHENSPSHRTSVSRSAVGGKQTLKDDTASIAKRGSPLARSDIISADESTGTSPSQQKFAKENKV